MFHGSFKLKELKIIVSDHEDIMDKVYVCRVEKEDETDRSNDNGEDFMTLENTGRNDEHNITARRERSADTQKESIAGAISTPWNILAWKLNERNDWI